MTMTATPARVIDDDGHLLGFAPDKILVRDGDTAYLVDFEGERAMCECPETGECDHLFAARSEFARIHTLEREVESADV